ncbi:MAG: gliding motility protein GldL [Bacteroidetes bacterium]|nr:gliding motility protein GldL [Bacteroidota bacterium]HET6243413.1 gliding motility protein GldL [Bacteroidia bacterium]
MKNKDTYFDFINFAYGIGAAIVIIGAMFKFLGWDYANEFFLVGLTTEAVVFSISAFEFKKKKTPASAVKVYHWENIFPQLLTSELHNPDVLSKVAEEQTLNTVAITKSLGNFNLAIEKLNEVSNQLVLGINTMSNAIKQLEKTTEDYSMEMGLLKENVQQLNSLHNSHLRSLALTLPCYEKEFINLSKSLCSINEKYINHNTSFDHASLVYDKQFKELNENLQKTNSIYLRQMNQLEDSSSGYEKEFTMLNENLLKINSFYTEHLSKNGRNSEDFEKEFASLGANMSKVNSFYTDMLGAVGRITRPTV